MKKFKVSKGYLVLMLLFSVFAVLPGCGGDSGGVSSEQAPVMTAFSLGGVTGTINEPAKSIAINMPYGTEVTALKAMYTANVTEVTVGSTAQTSTETANDFTLPVTYTLTTTSGSTTAYEVVVTLASPSAKAITSFSFNGYSGAAGVVNETAKTIAVTLPFATVVTDLVATFNTTGASVMIGTEVQTSGAAPGNDFTAPVAYIVNAADGSSATYTVTVDPALNFAKAISSYSFVGYPGAPGAIDEVAKSILVTLPFSPTFLTDVTNLTANFTTTGDSVMIGTTVQASGGAPANDFTSPVDYIVTAVDGTTATYRVTVTEDANTAKAITAFSFVEFPLDVGIIDEANKTIDLTLPSGTDPTALTAKFTTTGDSVKVGGFLQASEVDINDFTNPVLYLVTAADSNFIEYTVTLHEPLGPMTVDLGSAGNFVILAKSAVTTTGTTAVTGDIGLSPNAAIGYEGFGLIADSTNVFSTSSLVVGNVYASNYAPPTPSNMTTTISNMETAYTNAAGRTLPDFTELGAGDISGITLAPGLYKWGTGLLITDVGVTLSGDSNDVWIFQIGGDLTVNNAAIVTLAGGAQAKNIFWQVAGQTTLGTTSDFKGTILCQTLIAFNTGAVLNGRALSQTQVTLDATTITAPAQ